MAHAEEDFGLSYEQQYGGENAKRFHHLAGTYPLQYDAFDVYLKKGNKFDIFYSERWKKIVCTSDIGMGRVIFGSSESLLSAIVDCLLFGFHCAEEKKNFMERIHEIEG